MKLSPKVTSFAAASCVLYLAAEIAAKGARFAWGDAVLVVTALLCCWAAFAAKPRYPSQGRLRALGVAFSVVAVSALADSPATYTGAVGMVCLVVGAILVADLALGLPPHAARRPWLRKWRVWALPAAALAAALGVAAVMPHLHLGGRLVLVLPGYRLAPLVFAASCGALSVAIHAIKLRQAGAPEDRASHARVLGALCGSALIAAVVAGGSVAGWWPLLSSGARAALAAALLLTVAGHTWAFDLRMHKGSSPLMRKTAAGTFAVAAVAAAAAALPASFVQQPAARALVALGSAGLVACAYRLVHAALQRVFAPSGGRLLDAIATARCEVPNADCLEDFAQRLLQPFARATGRTFGSPLLLIPAPSQELRVDAAGLAHTVERPLPEGLIKHLLEGPRDPLVADSLEHQLVRRTELRPAATWIYKRNGLVVVPLWSRGELEGVLFIPKGQHVRTMALEELRALEQLSQTVAPLVGTWATQARAQKAAATARAERDQWMERCERLETEAHHLRELASVSKGLAYPSQGKLVAYSKAMKAFASRLHAVAASEAPALLVADPGIALAAHVRRLHAASSHASRHLLFLDCAALDVQTANETLFGTVDAPGWLQLAAEGTLALLHVSALPANTQSRLAETLATRRAQTAEGHASYAVAARLVCTALRPVEDLTLDPELSHRLAPQTVVIPPLRERLEDLPSLILLALDRATRELGRPAVGIDEAALRWLLAHPWPHNEQELQAVVRSAVQDCDEPKITIEHLPERLGPKNERSEQREPPQRNPLDGSHAEVERRMLEHAIKKAGGNKSEAARALGLKRTTFLDKLRRHSLDESPTNDHDRA